MSNLEGRVALMTGAARGIGAEIALQFARSGFVTRQVLYVDGGRTLG
jgi:NAD(P)-dependent dehydrogenase (short-subunit alcohol dehydrogenase family)